jgi:hypothetical protein
MGGLVSNSLFQVFKPIRSGLRRQTVYQINSNIPKARLKRRGYSFSGLGSGMDAS